MLAPAAVRAALRLLTLSGLLRDLLAPVRSSRPSSLAVPQMGCGASSSAAAQPKAADIAAAAPQAHAADTPEGAGDDAAAATGSKKPRKPVTLDDDSPPSSPGLAPRPSPAAPADTPVRANVFNPATPLPKTAHDKEPDAPTSSVKKGRGDGRKGSVTGTAEKKKSSKPKGQ